MAHVPPPSYDKMKARWRQRIENREHIKAAQRRLKLLHKEVEENNKMRLELEEKRELCVLLEAADRAVRSAVRAHYPYKFLGSLPRRVPANI